MKKRPYRGDSKEIGYPGDNRSEELNQENMEPQINTDERRFVVPAISKFLINASEFSVYSVVDCPWVKS